MSSRRVPTQDQRRPRLLNPFRSESFPRTRGLESPPERIAFVNNLGEERFALSKPKRVDSPRRRKLPRGGVDRSGPRGRLCSRETGLLQGRKSPLAAREAVKEREEGAMRRASRSPAGCGRTPHGRMASESCLAGARQRCSRPLSPAPGRVDVLLLHAYAPRAQIHRPSGRRGRHPSARSSPVPHDGASSVHPPP